MEEEDSINPIVLARLRKIFPDYVVPKRGPIPDPVFSTDGSRVAHLTEEEDRMLLGISVRTAKFAEKALEVYNKENHTDFVLVKPLMYQLAPACGFYYHLNFMARPKNAPPNSPSSLFFAEFYFHDSVTMCCILPTSSSSSSGDGNGISICCGVCSPHDKFRVYHPLDGYEVAKPEKGQRYR